MVPAKGSRHVAHTKHALWYRPVSRPSADEIDFPVIGSLQYLQLPRGRDGCRLCEAGREEVRDAGREGGREGWRLWCDVDHGTGGGERGRAAWMAGSSRRGDLGDGNGGDPCPAWIAGSLRPRYIGDLSGGDPVDVFCPA